MLTISKTFVFEAMNRGQQIVVKKTTETMPIEREGMPRRKRSIYRDSVRIHVYDEAGTVIKTHEHTGGFKEW
jgi:hypothetical protein